MGTQARADRVPALVALVLLSLLAPRPLSNNPEHTMPEPLPQHIFYGSSLGALEGRAWPSALPFSPPKHRAGHIENGNHVGGKLKLKHQSLSFLS